MTTPPRRPRPHGQQPSGHGEQPTHRLRPLSGLQRYGQHRPSAQQPPGGAHSGRHQRQRPHGGGTAIVTGIIAVLAIVLAGAGLLVLTDDKDEPAAGGSPTASRAPVSEPATQDGAPKPGAGTDAAVGECLMVEDVSETDTDVAAIDCADPLAVYRVGVREEGGGVRCPGRNYVSYTEESGLLLCLTLNAQPGECFHEAERLDTRVPCDSPDASYRVGEIHTDIEDAGRCGEDDAPNALTYPRPPLTICRLSVR
jgi:hypothetical protein